MRPSGEKPSWQRAQSPRIGTYLWPTFLRNRLEWRETFHQILTTQPPPKFTLSAAPVDVLPGSSGASRDWPEVLIHGELSQQCNA